MILQEDKKGLAKNMKEKLYTIELHDALTAGDECPFCWLERKLEQAAIEFVLRIWKVIYGTKQTAEVFAADIPNPCLIMEITWGMLGFLRLD